MTSDAQPPILADLTATLKQLQTSLGSFMLGVQRDDEPTRSAASARAIGSYRKLIALFQTLPLEAQADSFPVVVSLHESMQQMGIPVGPFRLNPPELPASSP